LSAPYEDLAPGYDPGLKCAMIGSGKRGMDGREEAVGMCLAVPGKIESLQGDDPLLRTGRVSFGGITKTVHLGCVPEAKIGDYVLVHVGVALSTIDEKEAEEVFRYLRQMGDLTDLEPDHDA
jgi:hydrogenase expression/formation protein HypC